LIFSRLHGVVISQKIGLFMTTGYENLKFLTSIKQFETELGNKPFKAY
jgi:hypothetical protein